MSAFASYAAVAIENARIYQSSQEQALVSTVMLQVAEAPVSSVLPTRYLTSCRPSGIVTLLYKRHGLLFPLWEPRCEATASPTGMKQESGGANGGSILEALPHRA